MSDPPLAPPVHPTASPPAPAALLEDPAATVDCASAPACGNCQTLLQGPYCHQCGQPKQSPVRELWTLLREGMGELFSLDGKFFSSLQPLLFRPGRLTREYLDGRRFSFIRPFRLYVGISIVLFLLVSARGGEDLGLRVNAGADGKSAALVVEDSPAEALAPVAVVLEQAPQEHAATATATTTAATAARSDAVPPQADANATAPPTPTAATTPKQAKQDPDANAFTIRWGNQTWDPRTAPLDIPWVPGWLDEVLREQLVIIIHNGNKVASDPQALVRSLLAHLPHAMFFLLPVFALMLKAVYLFRRRLYAEHLIVALHSHSYLFLSFILMLTLDSLAGRWPALRGTSTALIIALTAWMPIYLLIMQKRVYRQGWFWTSVKFAFTGVLYLALIVLTAALAFILALRFL